MVVVKLEYTQLFGTATRVDKMYEEITTFN